MSQFKKPKLTVELVPTTCHFSSARTILSKKQWDTVRFISYENANNKCQICGDNGLNQGYKHRVECHEIWGYDDDTHVQKLLGLISLCVLCHQVKHIGRAAKIGKETQCHNQLMIVNNWTIKETLKHIEDSFILHKERSKFQWTLDLSILNEEPYNLNIKLDGKRKFKKLKFKRKKKKIAKKKIVRKKRPKKY